jgi:hypothetical protein
MAKNRTPEDLRLHGFALQAIESNPLTAAEKRMFEMFDREGWSHEQRREYVLANLKKKPVAAE